ncbi:hypothetical protein GCM10007301_11410 [Azorhizobium oxalatiphilum]|uniref:DUF992 domain-containing protein n=1 Tax=Azorhizobium oxalatiphilum TaxID=980631 RepID=A0A917F5B0_9HYPH|nr:DUF992 domain-containing protein [Azorhizobium oxalatiphilum]GGF53666.1 hypothetical protein GCM10007301_11410 [Azorhizobium oxalatiphilum]
MDGLSEVRRKPHFLPLCIAATLLLTAGPVAAQDQSGRKSWVIDPAPGSTAPGTSPSATSPAAPQAPAATQAPTAQAPTAQAPAPLPTPPAIAPAPSSTLEEPSARVQAGLLECRGAMATAYGLGSTRDVTCEYRPAVGQNQYYAGTLNRAGLDFGISDQASMIWMVLATSANLGPSALAGEYVGFSSGAAIGPGFSANVLVAKDATTGIALQPLSVSSDSGLSISFAAASLTLKSVPAPKSAPSPKR